MNLSKRWLAVLGALTLVCLAGCADRDKDNVPDDTATKPEISKAVDKAGDATKKALTKAGDAAEEVAANGATTAKIKSAYIGDANLKASRINIDTISSQKTVILSGTVQNPAQKNLATQVARKNAPSGFKIVNNLKVASGKPASKKH